MTQECIHWLYTILLFYFQRKCECYWPECVKEPVYYGDLSIEIENESHLPEYVLRTITVTLVSFSLIL